jgi:hypothetical protein
MAHLYENVLFYSKRKSVESQKMAKHLTDNSITHAIHSTGDTPITDVRPCITYVKNEYDGENTIGGTESFVSAVTDLPADFTAKAETQVQYNARNA